MTIQAMNPVRTFFEPLTFFTRTGSPIPRGRAGKLPGAIPTQVIELVVNVYAAAGVFILLAIVAISLKAALSEINDGGFVLSILKQGLTAALNVSTIVDFLLLVVFLFRTTRQALGTLTSAGSLGSEFASARPGLWCAFALGTAVAFGSIIFLKKSPFFGPIPSPPLPRSLSPQDLAPPRVAYLKTPPVTPPNVPPPIQPTTPCEEPGGKSFGVCVGAHTNETNDSELQPFFNSLASVLNYQWEQNVPLLLNNKIKFRRSVQLIFTLKNDGSVDSGSIVIKLSSGNKEMDDEARESITGSRFPVFPVALSESAIKVDAEFWLRRTKNP
jgi:outer membrane biosynthesis protein TonB